MTPEKSVNFFWILGVGFQFITLSSFKFRHRKQVRNHSISLINGGSATPPKSRVCARGMLLAASNQTLQEFVVSQKRGFRGRAVPREVNPAP